VLSLAPNTFSNLSISETEQFEFWNSRASILGRDSIDE
jgi:hypothetical protein